MNNENSFRKINYHFFCLPFVERIKVGIQLELIRNEDEDVMNILDLSSNIIKRAKEENLLDALFILVKNRKEDG